MKLRLPKIMDRRLITMIPLMLFSNAPVFSQDFAIGVQRRFGNPSPGGGLSTGETNSRIDDYINQDEQINIDPETGVVRVLRTNQKNLINEYVTEAIPVKNVKISEILYTAKQIAAKEGGWAEVFFNPADGTQHVSVVVPPRQLPYVREAIQKLDTPWLRLFDDGSVQSVYQARNRPIDVVATIADGWAPFGGTEVDLRSNTATHSDEAVWSEMWHKAAFMIDVPVHQADLEVTLYEVRIDSGLRLGLDYIAWKNGPGRNLFQAILGGYESRQDFENQSSIFDPFSQAGMARLAEEVIESGAHQVQLSASFLITAAYLDFLANKGRARVLNSATLKLTSGKPASLDSISEVISFKVAPEAPAEGSLPSKQSVSLLQVHLGSDGKPERVQVDADGKAILLNGNFLPDAYGKYVLEPIQLSEDIYERELTRSSSVDIGLSLDFTPSISLETMELGIEMTETYVNGLSPSGDPIVGEKTVQSEVRLADGQPLVLMGTRHKAAIESANKMPFLGSIPVIGKLFGQENNYEGETRMVAVITPRMYALPPNPYERNDWSQGESDMAVGDTTGLTPALAEARAQATRASDAPLPETSFGFDQWLFDSADNL